MKTNMSEQELEKLCFLSLLKNELLSFSISLETQIAIYEGLFESFGRKAEVKEKNQEVLFRFLKTVKKFGPVDGTKLIIEEIKDDDSWMETFKHFFLLGGLNEQIIKKLLSINKEMREEDLRGLEEVDSLLADLKMLREKNNN